MQRFSYPRTYHFPWSPGATSDDKYIKDSKCFDGKTVVITEKRDGENTTLYPDGYVHARSIDGTGKEYQSWIIRKWREVAYQLDSHLHICGENLFARHSIAYDDLKSYFEVFGLYDAETCYSWKDTTDIAELLGLDVVPVLYEGLWDESIAMAIADQVLQNSGEGIVVRSAGAFRTADFGQNVAKYVRANHVTTDAHWTRNWVPNGLAE